MNNTIIYTNGIIDVYKHDGSYFKAYNFSKLNYKRDVTKGELNVIDVVSRDLMIPKVGYIVQMLIFQSLIYGVISKVEIKDLYLTLTILWGVDAVTYDIFIPNKSYNPTGLYGVRVDNNHRTSFGAGGQFGNVVSGDDYWLGRDLAMRQIMRNDHHYESFEFDGGVVVCTLKHNPKIQFNIKFDDPEVLNLVEEFSDDVFNTLVVIDPKLNGNSKSFYQNSIKPDYAIYQTHELSIATEGGQTATENQEPSYDEFSQLDADAIFKSQEYSNNVTFDLPLNNSKFTNDDYKFNLLGRKIKYYSSDRGAIDTIIGRVEFSEVLVHVVLGITRTKYSQQKNNDLRR